MLEDLYNMLRWIPNMDQLRQIVMNMSQTGYLGSIHEVKILAYLIKSPTNITGKQICKDLNLPDSKVIPH